MLIGQLQWREEGGTRIRRPPSALDSVTRRPQLATSTSTRHPLLTSIRSPNRSPVRIVLHCILRSYGGRRKAWMRSRKHSGGCLRGGGDGFDHINTCLTQAPTDFGGGMEANSRGARLFKRTAQSTGARWAALGGRRCGHDWPQTIYMPLSMYNVSALTVSRQS